MINIYIATIFPEIFPGSLGVSLLKKAEIKKIWKLHIIDLGIFDNKRRIDDKIFGGMPGMIIKPDIIEKLIQYNNIPWTKIFYTNPKGNLLNQNYLLNLLNEINIFQKTQINESYNILIITGRYEGIDQRVIDYFKIEEFSNQFTVRLLKVLSSLINWSTM